MTQYFCTSGSANSTDTFVEVLPHMVPGCLNKYGQNQRCARLVIVEDNN